MTLSLPDVFANDAFAPSWAAPRLKPVRTYDDNVERWRNQLEDLMPAHLKRRSDAAELLDKALWTMGPESGGDPQAGGGGGAAWGLFQSHHIPPGSDVVTQINDLWRMVSNNPTQWTDWGENNTWFNPATGKDEVFGALGHYPYPGSDPNAKPPGGGVPGGGVQRTGPTAGLATGRLLTMDDEKFTSVMDKVNKARTEDEMSTRRLLSPEPVGGFFGGQFGQADPNNPAVSDAENTRRQDMASRLLDESQTSEHVDPGARGTLRGAAEAGRKGVSMYSAIPEGAAKNPLLTAQLLAGSFAPVGGVGFGGAGAEATSLVAPKAATGLLPALGNFVKQLPGQAAVGALAGPPVQAAVEAVPGYESLPDPAKSVVSMLPWMAGGPGKITNKLTGAVGAGLAGYAAEPVDEALNTPEIPGLGRPATLAAMIAGGVAGHNAPGLAAKLRVAMPSGADMYHPPILEGGGKGGGLSTKEYVDFAANPIGFLLQDQRGLDALKNISRRLGRNYGPGYGQGSVVGPGEKPDVEVLGETPQERRYGQQVRSSFEETYGPERTVKTENSLIQGGNTWADYGDSLKAMEPDNPKWERAPQDLSVAPKNPNDPASVADAMRQSVQNVRAERTGAGARAQMEAATRARTGGTGSMLPRERPAAPEPKPADETPAERVRPTTTWRINTGDQSKVVETLAGSPSGSPAEAQARYADSVAEARRLRTEATGARKLGAAQQAAEGVRKLRDTMGGQNSIVPRRPQPSAREKLPGPDDIMFAGEPGQPTLDQLGARHGIDLSAWKSADAKRRVLGMRLNELRQQNPELPPKIGDAYDYQAGDTNLNVVNRGHASEGGPQIFEFTIERATAGEAADSFQGRARGSDLESLRGTGEIINQLRAENPDALFISTPTDTRRSRIYQRVGWREPNAAELNMPGFPSDDRTLVLDKGIDSRPQSARGLGGQGSIAGPQRGPAEDVPEVKVSRGAKFPVLKPEVLDKFKLVPPPEGTPKGRLNQPEGVAKAVVIVHNQPNLEASVGPVSGNGQRVGNMWVGGLPGVDDWIKITEDSAGAAQRLRDSRYYAEVPQEITRALQSKNAAEGDRQVRAYAMGNRRTSSERAAGDVMRVEERLQGVQREGLGSMNADIIGNALNDSPDIAGVGPKLSDFEDILTGKDQARSWAHDDPRAGRPFVADTHTSRDAGYIDPEITRYVQKKTGRTLEELGLKADNATDSFNPSPAQYELVSRWGNDLTDALNERGWMGKSDWIPAEIQAIGWARVRRELGLADSGFQSIRDANTRRIAIPSVERQLAARGVEVSPGELERISTRYVEAMVDTVKGAIPQARIERVDSQGLGGVHYDVFSSPETAHEVASAISHHVEGPVVTFRRAGPSAKTPFNDISTEGGFSAAQAEQVRRATEGLVTGVTYTTDGSLRLIGTPAGEAGQQRLRAALDAVFPNTDVEFQAPGKGDLAIVGEGGSHADALSALERSRPDAARALQSSDSLRSQWFDSAVADVRGSSGAVAAPGTGAGLGGPGSIVGRSRRPTGPVERSGSIEEGQRPLGDILEQAPSNIPGEPPASHWQKLGRELVGVAGLPRTLMTAADVGAIFRNIPILGARGPGLFASAAKDTVRAFRSEAVARAAKDAVEASPLYDTAVDRAGLKLWDWGEGVKAENRVAGYEGLNESMVSKWVERAPWIKGSERAMATAQNVMGMKTFEKWAQPILEMEKAGKMTEAQATRRLEDLGSVINHSRGFSGSKAAEVASKLNFFFSAQFTASRFQVLADPLVMMMRGSPEARNLAAQSLLSFMGANALMLGTLGAAGSATGAFSVNPDPRSSEFGQLKIGNTRFDTQAGLGPLVKLLARTGAIGADTAFGTNLSRDQDKAGSLIKTYFENKAQPLAKAVTDFLEDNKLPSIKDIPTWFAPMLATGIYETLKTEGVNPVGVGLAGAGAVASAVGIGANSYTTADDEKAQIAKDVFGKGLDELTPAQRLRVVDRLPDDLSKSGKTAERARYTEALSAAGHVAKAPEGESEEAKEVRERNNAQVFKDNPELDLQRWYFANTKGGSLRSKEAVDMALEAGFEDRAVKYSDTDRNLAENEDSKAAWTRYGRVLERIEDTVNNRDNLASYSQFLFKKNFVDLKPTEQARVRAEIREGARDNAKVQAIEVFFGDKHPNANNEITVSPAVLTELQAIWKEFPKAPKTAKPKTKLLQSSR